MSFWQNFNDFSVNGFPFVLVKKIEVNSTALDMFYVAIMEYVQFITSSVTSVMLLIAKSCMLQYLPKKTIK